VLLPRRRPLRALGAAALAAILALGACTGERPTQADEPDSRASTTTSSSSTTTTTAAPEPAARVAQAKAPRIAVFATATDPTPAQEIVAGVDTSAETIPIVFLVADGADPQDDRIHVHLPVRPNGSTGFVNRAEVDLIDVPYRMEVGLTEHRIRVYRDEELLVDEPVGVGRSDRPTPGGTYYLKELLQPPDPTGPYGTYAYGLSGFSNVLQSFNGGTGVIGIHGTNEPEAIGTDVSSGCIRLHNDVIERLVEEIGLPLGTPVEIQA